MFHNTLKTELKRALGGWSFWMALIAAFGLLIIVSPELLKIWEPRPEWRWGEELRPMGHVIFILQALPITSALVLVIPAICALPHAASYSDEYQTQFRTPYLMRAGHRSYVYSKVIASGVAGGLVLMLPYLLYALLAYIKYPSPLPEYWQSLGGISDDGQWVGNEPWARFMTSNYGIPYVATVALRFFAHGFVWAQAALAISAFFPNRYLALSVPYVIYTLIWFLSGRISLTSLDPMMAIADYKVERAGILMLAINLLFYLCLWVSLFYYKSKDVIKKG